MVAVTVAELPNIKVGDRVRAALKDADEISTRIASGGYRANRYDTETLRNHVRKLARIISDLTLIEDEGHE